MSDLRSALQQGQVVSCGGDVHFLEYGRFQGQTYHFPGHRFVVCGWYSDGLEVLERDRLEPYLCPATDLEAAMRSPYQFPEHSAMYHSLRFAREGCSWEEELAGAIERALVTSAKVMLGVQQQPVLEVQEGLAAMDAFVELLRTRVLSSEAYASLYNLSELYGTGGGLFRFL
eukprot:CAMPEP_0177631124 /NCGR_PEP_ID=MMETSP0447-20121125/1579_1 /TAXON_ID=0 /ORGANISM="Stygamoeba regulata, Strain BSH-02190019" /LENGTH=171 /DNA_ID=CAMNT_0019132581 /DNA_START=80 /DNA_END=592 /DNA_ORIENTATION=-